MTSVTLFVSRQGIHMATTPTGPRTHSHACVVSPEEAAVIRRVAGRARWAVELPAVDERDDERELASLDGDFPRQRGPR